MKQLISPLAAIVATVVLTLPQLAAAQTAPAIPPILVTPNTVDTRIGKLEFKDGAPALSVGIDNGLRPGRARDPYKSRHYEAALRSSKSDDVTTPGARFGYDHSRK